MSNSSPQQIELIPSVASRLDSHEGQLDFDIVATTIGSNDRTNIAILAGLLGRTLSEAPRTSDITDQPLDVHRDDFDRARPLYLRQGLYMPFGDPRRRNAKQLAVIGNEKPRLELPGVVGRHDGVVVSEQEHIWVVRNALDMAKAVDAKTRRANRDLSDKEEVEEKAGRSVAHAMEAKRDTLYSLESDLAGQRDVLARVARDAKLVWRTAYIGKNLDRDRKEADELIHETARIASINLGYGTTIVKAIHRAIASDLYRRGSARELAFSWRNMTAFVGRYTNAKRGKVDQSLQACERQLAARVHYLEAA